MRQGSIELKSIANSHPIQVEINSSVGGSHRSQNSGRVVLDTLSPAFF